MSTTSDVESPAGHGYRYTGEQQFYTFDLGMGNHALPQSADPWTFQPGLNVILESRAAFLNSTVGNSSKVGGGIGAIDSLPCLTGSTVTARSGSNASQMGTAGTWEADLSSSTFCQDTAASLLYKLVPLNATGNHSALSAHKGWLKLNGTQVELLGLDPQTLLLAPFVVPSWEQTPSGPAVSTWATELAADAMSVWDALPGALVAYGNFIETLASDMGRTLGNWFIGLCKDAATAESDAISWARTAEENLVSGLLWWAELILEDAIQPIITLAHGFEQSMNAAANGYLGALENSFSSNTELGGGWNATFSLLLSILGGNSSSYLFRLAEDVQDPWQLAVQTISPYLPPNSAQFVNAFTQAFYGFQTGGRFSLIGGTAMGMGATLGLTSEFIGLSGFLDAVGLSNKVISAPPSTPMPYNDNRTHFIYATNDVSFDNLSNLYSGISTTGRSNVSNALEDVRFGVLFAVTIASMFAVYASNKAYSDWAAKWTDLYQYPPEERVLLEEGLTGEGTELNRGIAGAGLTIAIASLVIGAVLLYYESSESYHTADEMLLVLSATLDFVGATLAIIDSDGNDYVAAGSAIALTLGACELYLGYLHG